MNCSNRSSKLPGLVAAVAMAAGSLVALPELAEAQERVNPLDGQPAVRHRLLLVKGRFEFTPAFESTINADYKHTVSGGLKLEYHVSDMLSFGAVGFYGSSFNTGLADRIIATLPPEQADGDPTPSRSQYEQHLNSMPIHGAAYVTITPWYGKLAAFQRLFVNFDFYFSGGVSFAKLESDCAGNICTDQNPGVLDPGRMLVPDNNPNNDPPLNDGTRVGLYLGGGIHVFLNQFIALDFTIRDYIFRNNPSGLDFDADLAVTDDDSRLLNHLFMGVGISVFLPARAQRTN